MMSRTERVKQAVEAGLIPANVPVAAVNVRDMLAGGFSEGVEFEYRFVISQDGKHATVAVNTNCYGRELSFAVLLAEVLRAAIPVPYKQASEPKIEILGGDRRSGMMSVEMSIEVPLPEGVFRAYLEAAGFWEGLENTK